jgi:multifunctional methyltransferase subunit TRM112
MKFLTTNFVQCAVHSCARSQHAFPLEYSSVEMVQQEVDFDPEFVANILPKLNWEALVDVAHQVCNETMLGI